MPFIPFPIFPWACVFVFSGMCMCKFAFSVVTFFSSVCTVCYRWYRETRVAISVSWTASCRFSVGIRRDKRLSDRLVRVELWLILRIYSPCRCAYVCISSYVCDILMYGCIFVWDEIRDAEKDGRPLIRCAPCDIFLCFLWYCSLFQLTRCMIFTSL